MGTLRQWLRYSLLWLWGAWLLSSPALFLTHAAPAPVPAEDLVPLVPERPRVRPPAAPAPKKDAGRLRALPVPDDAVRDALADVLTLAPYARRYARYVWVREGALDLDEAGRIKAPPTLSRDGKAVALTLGAVSRSVFPGVRPAPVGRGTVLRIDLRAYDPRRGGRKPWPELWEELRFDPDFNLLLTRDELALAARYGADTHRPERVAPDVDVVRVEPPHVGLDALHDLKHETYSEAPVVSDRYLAWRLLNTVKASGVYKAIWGGLYFEFRGVRRVKDLRGEEAKDAERAKATDLDVLLDAAGIGNIKAGLTYDRLFERLRSDQRVAVFKSGVTGKPREVEWFHGPDSRDGTGALSITHDLADKDVDIGTHPLYNLEHARAAAFEVIAEATNGFPVYAIYDGDHKLLDNADANAVVADRTVPAPFPPVLQSGDSCYACHCAQGDVGWKDLKNDAKRLLAKRLDVFGDVGFKDAFGPGTVERIAGHYAGNFDKHIRRARDDFDEATLACTGPWPGAGDQVNVVKPAWTHVVDRSRGYWYGEVTPDVALRELGLAAPKGKAAAVLTALLPPDPAAAVTLPDVEPFVAENPVAGALKEGLSVPRSDFDLQKTFFALRAQKTLAAMRRARP